MKNKDKAKGVLLNSRAKQADRGIAHPPSSLHCFC